MRGLCLVCTALIVEKAQRADMHLYETLAEPQRHGALRPCSHPGANAARRVSGENGRSGPVGVLGIFSSSHFRQWCAIASMARHSKNPRASHTSPPSPTASRTHTTSGCPMDGLRSQNCGLRAYLTLLGFDSGPIVARSFRIFLGIRGSIRLRHQKSSRYPRRTSRPFHSLPSAAPSGRSFRSLNSGFGLCCM
ncbi:hypothetical protein FKP32DRAFT_950434 [Trametes sanguinea]|nr:hypothetical protein FKP32DRAFT_950434 [Trametes sanguinea]